MPHAKILTTQATHTPEQLHAELGGKILDNKAQADRPREAMVHVEAVLKMLDPAHNLRTIAVRRRRPNLWFAGAHDVEYAPYHLCSSKTVVHKIYHDEAHPSHLLLPVIPLA